MAIAAVPSDMSGTLSLAQTAQVRDRTTTAGAANAAVLDLGDLRSNVDIFVEVSGAATLTVEASATGDFGGEEHVVETVDFGSAGTDLRQYDLAFQHVRAYTDTALVEIDAVGRGV